MNKALLTLILMLGLGPPVFAQQAQTGAITTAGTDCSVATTCVVLTLDYTAGSSTITLNPTWTGTVQFEGTADSTPTNASNWYALNAYPVNSTTAATSATAVGLWTLNSANLTAIRVRCSTFGSGTINVIIRASAAASAKIGGSGSGLTGLTAGDILQAGSGTTAVNSTPLLDNGVTTANTLTYAGTGGLAIPNGGIATGWATVPAAGTITLPATAAPAAPASGIIEWFDNTDQRLHGINSASGIGTSSVAKANVSHQWFNSMSTAGVFTSTQPADSDLSFTDITTGNASTSAHGFAPKGDNVATHFLNGQLGWTTPASAGGPVNQFAGLTDFLCDINTGTFGSYTCATQISGITYFANYLTIATAATAGTIDGTHHGLIIDMVYDIETGSGTMSSIVFRPTFCSALPSSTSCTGLKQFSGLAVTPTLSQTNTQTLRCLVSPTATATTFSVGCTSGVGGATIIGNTVNPIITSVPNTSTNWIFVMGLSFTTGAQNMVVGQVTLGYTWVQ